MKQVTLTINGQKVEAPEESTVLEAARAAGITIPTLCYHKDLTPVGLCRLCVVEVEGSRLLQAACTLPVADGMVVHTESPTAVEARKFVLEMLLSDHPNECMICEKNGDCELQRWVYHYQVPWPEHGGARHRYLVDSDPNPVISVDLNKCILCGRCVRACAEIQGRDVWGFGYRGFETRLSAGADQPMLEARCESCGQCVAYCPTAALFDKMSLGWGRIYQQKQVVTTCSYCGVGCQLVLNVRDNRITRVTSHFDALVNGAALCVKGRYGYDYVHHPERLTSPLVRARWLPAEGRPQGAGDEDFVETDWETALDIVAHQLAEVKRTYGGDATAILTSAKCTNEENYLMQKLARQVLGTNNVDHCARLCHSSTVAGLAMAFGSGAMSNSMRDVAQEARAYLVIGSNTTEQHPVFGIQLRQAVRQRGAKLVVADPRRIDLTEYATLHLRQRPGTDIALINGLMYVILRDGLEDREFIETRTENFEAFKEVVMHYPPKRVAEITGVPAEDIEKAAHILAENKPMAVIWSMGITQHTHGVQNVLSLANLQMLLGNMGVPGGGVNPLRGQNNVQGACDVGGLPNVYPGYQNVADPAVKEKFERLWGGPLSDRVGLTVVEIIDAFGRGEIKALYILAENPVVTDPDVGHVRECLERGGFLVVQDIFLTETGKYADVMLPGVSFAEKDGTYTNTERRVQLVRQAIQPHPNTRQDWWITTEIAKRIIAHSKMALDPNAPYAGWNYNHPAQIMEELAATAPIYAGIRHERLAPNGLQWPVRSLDHAGTPILHVGKFTRGKGLFVPCEHLEPAEAPDESYPFLMTTGRVVYHWHSGEMTRRARGLSALYPQPLVEISLEDAQRLGIADGSLVRLTSRRGEIVAPAQVTERVYPGLVFTTFHFPAEAANWLTSAEHLDPLAKIPEYKVCAVAIERVDGRD